MTKVQTSIADVTKDGTISDVDAVVVLRYVVGLIDTLPAPGNYLAQGSTGFGDCNYERDGIVEVPVKMDGVAELMGFEMTLSYDNDKLEFLEVAPGAFSSSFNFETKATEGAVKIAGISMENISGSGDVLKFKFRTRSSQKGSTKIYLSRVRLNENKEEFGVAEKEIDIISSAKEMNGLPKDFSMSENYPNPFNPTTRIDFALPEESTVTLQIFNLIGEKVADLIHEVKPAGYYSLNWNASNSPSGIYIVRINAASKSSSQRFTICKKAVLLK
jgi:hypothetical protein